MPQLEFGRSSGAKLCGETLGRNRLAPVLEIAHLTASPAFNDVSLTINAGEITGIFGFLGAGMTEVARTLFGQTHAQSGTIRLNGVLVRPKTPLAAKRLGVAYLTENRRTTIFPRHEIYTYHNTLSLHDALPIYAAA